MKLRPKVSKTGARSSQCQWRWIFPVRRRPFFLSSFHIFIPRLLFEAPPQLAMNPHRPAPLPSHPLLSSSIALPHSNSANSQSNGALSALSAVLLGSKRSELPPKNEGSTLLARRLAKGGQTMIINEVVEMEFDFLRPFQFRPPRSQKREVLKAGSSAGGLEDVADIPPLDQEGSKRKRVRKSSREEEAGDGEPDLPPSPVMLPGSWNYGAEGGLMLPGPFLEAGSSRDSFDGLLFFLE